MPKVFESELRFLKLLWENEPINSTRLSKICADELGWSKATTYTVIRRLSQREIIKNENATVSSIVSKDEVLSAEINELVDKSFDGSIPSFIAAFASSRRLSHREAEQLRRLIDEHEEK